MKGKRGRKEKRRRGQGREGKEGKEGKGTGGEGSPGLSRDRVGNPNYTADITGIGDRSEVTVDIDLN